MDNFLEELPTHLRDLAIKAHIKSIEECILTPMDHLLMENDCQPNDVYALKTHAAKLIAQKLKTASKLLHHSHWSRLSFGVFALDKCTSGGIVTRGITELCGSSGAGKTQILLQLSLIVQLPYTLQGLDAQVAFICTEDTFPSKRLFEMSKVFSKRYPENEINYMSGVHIEHIRNSDNLLDCVSERLPQLMTNVRIGLVVIDSVAAIFRPYSDYIKRARDMRKLAHNLLYLADRYSCAIVCVNQVASISDKEHDVPCLGLSWAHLGRTRLRISRLPKQINQGNNLFTVRKLEIMYSPDTPNDSTEFLITQDGIVDVPGNTKYTT